MTETIIKARFQKAGKFKHLFSGSKCIIPISVGQAYHEGEKFAATMRLVNKNFKECVIVICDSLQRHSLKFKYNLTDEEAHRSSIKKGEEWLARNKKVINQLTIPYQITRWDNWLNYSDNKKIKNIVENLYEMDAHFRKAYLDTVNCFMTRYEKQLGHKPVDYNVVFHCSFQYTLEEAIIAPLWNYLQIEFGVYPATMAKAIISTNNYLCKVQKLMSIYWIGIKFYRAYAKDFKETSFLIEHDMMREKAGQ